jgi:hypothetical protein
MSTFRSLSILGLLALTVAACEPDRSSTPLAYTTGTVQEQLRSIQLQSARSGANPGMQNRRWSG